MPYFSLRYRLMSSVLWHYSRTLQSTRPEIHILLWQHQNEVRNITAYDILKVLKVKSAKSIRIIKQYTICLGLPTASHDILKILSKAGLHVFVLNSSLLLLSKSPQ